MGNITEDAGGDKDDREDTSESSVYMNDVVKVAVIIMVIMEKKEYIFSSSFSMRLSPYLFLLEDPLNSGCRLALHIDVKLNIASSLDGGLFEVGSVDARLDC